MTDTDVLHTEQQINLSPRSDHLRLKRVPNRSSRRSENLSDLITDPIDLIYEDLFPLRDQAGLIEEALTLHADQFNTIASCLAAAYAQLQQRGAAVIQGAPLNHLSQLHTWCSQFGTQMDYLGGTNARKQQGNGVLNVGSEPPWINVAIHNEMSYANFYPELFIIGCEAASEGVAPTIVGDNQRMTELLLKIPLGEKLMRLGVRYIRNFGNADNAEADGKAFTHWQDVFDTSDRAKAEAKAQIRLGGNSPCEFDWQVDGSLRLTYAAPAFEYDPTTQKNLCFTSIGNHGYWFRNWRHYNTLDNSDRPFHMQFGDGSEFSEAELADMARIGNASAIPIHWQAGKIALLDNRRYTHARPRYEAQPNAVRRLGVVLLNPVQRKGQHEAV